MGKTDQQTIPKSKLTLAELQAKSFKCSDKVLSDLKAGLQRDFTIIQACHYARINPDTYYDWAKQSDEFVEEMAIAKTDFLRRAKKVLIDAIDKGDGELALKVLERRERDLYSLKTEVIIEDLREEDNKPIDLAILDLQNELRATQETTSSSTTTNQEGASEAAAGYTILKAT